MDTPPPAHGDVRLRLAVAYDGAAFRGWARQPGVRTVQGELERALRAALRVPGGVPVRAAVAGRTDAGVHATGQVCHADVPRASLDVVAVQRSRTGEQLAPAASDPGPGETTVDPLLRRLNGILSSDMRVRSVRIAPPGFDARWSALWRRYEYVVADLAAVVDPRTRGHVLWHPRALDIPAMNRSARALLGEHDFAAFCRARHGASTVRTLLDIDWARPPSGSAHAGAAVLSLQADAFCHSMVRALVGAFLAVGEGRWSSERPAQLLGAGERVPAVATAPAHGLTLVGVGYPPDADLAAQARRSRRWRGE